MNLQDLKDFKKPELEHRFLRGGLPPLFLAQEASGRDYQEWMDAYWAKDVQELFRLERRDSFQKFAELLFAQSGSIFEATRFARSCEVSRTTIANYLAALEATFVVHRLKPYTTHRSTEIISAPKVYAFDTGFVCYHRGWNRLRPTDRGVLWEHFVLNELHSRLQTRHIQYWRDKRQHEVDFVVARPGRPPVAIECKWSASHFDASSLNAFAYQYPDASLVVVANDVDKTYRRRYQENLVEFVSLPGLLRKLERKSPRRPK